MTDMNINVPLTRKRGALVSLVKGGNARHIISGLILSRKKDGQKCVYSEAEALAVAHSALAEADLDGILSDREVLCRVRKRMVTVQYYIDNPPKPEDFYVPSVKPEADEAEPLPFSREGIRATSYLGTDGQWYRGCVPLSDSQCSYAGLHKYN